MAVCFPPGYETGRNDLSIFLTNELGVPTNAAEITYAIYFVDTSMGFPGQEVLIGPPNRVPVNPSVGEYYAALLVPPGASAGPYRIRWTVRRLIGQDPQVVVQEFNVEGKTPHFERTYSRCEKELMDKLRILLRDNNPDRNLKFAPPEQEGVIGKYNRVFGYLWEDLELYTYLQMALDQWNSLPPETEYLGNLNMLCQRKPVWKTFVIWYAAVFAMFAMTSSWIANEFDYSIGGISLSLEKSSKYQSLKDNAEQQAQKAAEVKMQTVKVIRGLQQPRFGQGVRSAFGPSVGRGVLSPRSFL